MTREAVASAIAAPEADGRDVTNAAIREHIGRGSLRDIQRHRAALAAESAATGVVAVADTAEDPPAAAVPLEEERLHTAQARVEAAQHQLDAAQRHLTQLERELRPVLNTRVFLLAAVNSGTIRRDDPAWADFDQASGQIHAAKQAVQQADADLRAAENVRHARLREQALERVAQTPEGQELLAKIAVCEEQKKSHDNFEGKSMYVAMGFQIGRLNAQLKTLIDQSMPAKAPPPTVDLAPLRAHYEAAVDFRPTTLDVFAVDSAMLRLLLEEVRHAVGQASAEVVRYEQDDTLRQLHWNHPQLAPYRRAQDRRGRSMRMAGLIESDMHRVEQRAGAAGRFV